MIIPPDGQWTSNGKSNTRGSMWSSLNLDLSSNEGTTRVSPRTIITTDDITDLGVAVGFDTFTDQNNAIQYVWAPAGSYVFRMNLASGYQTAFAKDASSGTPTSCSSDSSDIAHYGKTFMVVTVPNDIFRYNASAGTWNDGANELTSGGVHMLCVFGNRFYVTDEDTKIKSFTPANYNAITASGSNTLNLTNKGWEVTSISTIKPNSRRIWVGTINQSERGCWMFAWDGATANDPNEAYFIPDASGVLACVIENDEPVIMDNTGWLRKFNGGTFERIPNGRLPIKNTKLLKNSLSTLNDRWIHPNGMVLEDSKIRILIDNEYEDNGATIEENLPSGVWEFDSTTGWTHICSLSLYTSSITDMGQNRVSRVGALYSARTETTNASANGTMLMGAQIYSDASTTKEVISINDSNDTLQKAGYVVTTQVGATNLTEAWQKAGIAHKRFLDSSDKIVVKYRTAEQAPKEATITWTSATTFTSTSSNFASYSVGDEVEGIQGKGSGMCAHITAISENAGTYTVTVDETFTGATSGTAKVRLQKWKKLGTASGQTKTFASWTIPAVTSPWIQFKIFMLFTGENEFDRLVVDSSKSE